MEHKKYDHDAWMKKIEDGIAMGPYRPDWASLSEHPIPKWFRDAKFGLFLHWGLYSIPAFGSEWYSRYMYVKGKPEFAHHVETYGPQSKFGYKDFIPLFKAEKFDPDAWADLFVRSGAKYVIPVAEHHDGFQMYRSELLEYNAYDMGPGRDLVGDLTKSLNSRGLITGASSHRIEHWFFFNHGRDFPSDVPDNAKELGDFYWPAENVSDADYPGNSDCKPQPTAEFLDDWMFRTVEIIDRLHPSELYFDWWIMQRVARPYLRKIACYYYNRAAQWNKEVLITAKLDAFPLGAAVQDIERGQFATAQILPWQTDTAVAKNSWCYTDANVYKKPGVILADFVDCIAKNGCMLLNVGPKADGTISEEDTRILLVIGDWMHRNAEAVYGSRPWKIAEEGPTRAKIGAFSDSTDSVYTSEDFRFTTANGNIYVFVMNLPESGKILIKTLAHTGEPSGSDFNGLIRNVELLGYSRETLTDWKQTKEGLAVTAKVRSEAPVVLKIELE